MTALQESGTIKPTNHAVYVEVVSHSKAGVRYTKSRLTIPPFPQGRNRKERRSKK